MRKIGSFFKASSRPYALSHSLGNVALVVALGFVSSLSPASVRAQSTTAGIFGHAPAGETITASSMTTGMHRQTTVDRKGRYKFHSLPPGDYTVSLEKDTQVVDKQSNVTLLAARNAEIDFACPHDQCAASQDP